MTDKQPEITLDDILAELSPHGRELVEQAIGSARRVKALRTELARLANDGQSTDTGGADRSLRPA